MHHTLRLVPLAALPLALVLAASPALALNPEDIAAVGTFRYDTDFGHLDPSFDKLRLDELELSFQGYVTPFARADIFLSKADETASTSFSVEEMFMTLEALPWDLGGRFGKYKASFGKLNRLHPEQWFFINQPFAYQNFFGNDNLDDFGVEFWHQIPNPNDQFLQLTVGALNGNAPALNNGTVGKAVNAKLSTYFELNDDAGLEAGVSQVTGPMPAGGLSTVAGLDLTYRWRPDPTTSFTVIGEYLANARQGQGTPTGWYATANYQVATAHEFGVRVDQAWSLANPGEQDWDLAGFYTFAWGETNRYRVELARGVFPDHLAVGTAPDTRLMLQSIFALGPHKHPLTF